MKLLNLSLKGFRQHRSTEIEFKPGLTGIVGVNGSGKSTLIEAIAFCLYGSKALRGKIEHVRSLGLGNKQEVKVKLGFEHEGISYRLERTLNDASLFIAGESDACVKGNLEVVAKITSLFSMNYEEFSATFFTEQKGLEFLSGKKGATERERFIVRMMGYDKLREIQELLRSDRKEKKNFISAWESGMGSREAICQQIREEENLLKLISDKHTDASRVLSAAEKEASTCKNAFDKLNQSYLEFIQIKQKITNDQFRFDERSARIKTLESKLKDVKKTSAKLDDISLQFVEIDLLADASERDPVKLSELCQSGIRGLNTKIDKNQNEIETLRSQWLAQVLSIKSDCASLKKEINSLDSRASNLNKLDSKSSCPTCGQSLNGSLPQAREHLQAEIDQLKKTLLEKQSQLKDAENEPLTIKDLHAANNVLKNKVEVALRIKNSLLELTYLHKEEEVLRQEILDLRKELETMHDGIARQRKAAAKLNFSEEQHQTLKTQMESSQNLLQVARLQRLKLEGELNTRQALLQRSKTSLQEYDSKNLRLADLKAEFQVLEQSDQVLTDLRKRLNAELRPRLALIAGDYLSELSDGRYSAIEIAQDFTPLVVQDGEIKSVISGGEEDLLNLCLRLALSSMLAERSGQVFSTLILDEVFGSLDENRRVNVLNLLERLSSRFEQILVITHLEDIREGVHNLISVNYNETSGELSIEDKIETAGDLAFNL